uniref:Uncharacterized protein n=1 Tax=Macrostomum lignano TaxID=282301 RepID=A0A1I8F2V1_9PLAT
MAAHLMATIR